MGLFNLFRKKVKVSSERLSFEELLAKAADDPSYRADFSKRLLTETLVAITKPGSTSSEKKKFDINDKLYLSRLENGRIPIFTSIDRIFDKGVVKDQVEYIQAKGEDIFINTPGANFILNPYSDYRKDINALEIKALISGEFLSDDYEQTIEIKEPTPIKIGQPAVYPQKSVKALIDVYSRTPDVIAAYVGWIHIPSSQDPPHYIFAIETNGDWKTVSQLTGRTAMQHLLPDQIIDIIQIGKSSMSDYFTIQTQPFYKKRSA